EEFMEYFNKCKEFTMTSKQRLFALYEAVNYIKKHSIEGDIVECGVWRGGSSMMAALALNDDTTRGLYLYDTFEGMNAPTEDDVNMVGEAAEETWQGRDKCEAEIDEVRKNMALTKYPDQEIRYVAGMVEDTIPKTVPEKISILRLDTDWYESTYHELVNLYPKLVKGGVLIIDDYGHWQGAKKAVDQYFEENKLPILLNRIDYTGRIAIKV
ncbi:MAG: O-methyltransferase, partial [Oceanospirillaceae bacterium]